MFRTVLLSIIRSFSLYTQQYIQVCWQLASRIRAEHSDPARKLSAKSWSCSQAVNKPVWHIPLLCVQWKTPGDGQRNCPKHVEFYSKNKFEKLVHLVGFTIRTTHLVQFVLISVHVLRNGPFNLMWTATTLLFHYYQSHMPKFSQNFKEHQRKILHHVTCSIPLLTGSGHTRVTTTPPPIYRVIHKSLRDFENWLRNNQDRHGRKKHINV